MGGLLLLRGGKIRTPENRKRRATQANLRTSRQGSINFSMKTLDLNDGLKEMFAGTYLPIKLLVQYFLRLTQAKEQDVVNYPSSR